MTQATVKTYFSGDRRRKVEIFRRDDGTFGFEEWKYGHEEQSWYPSGYYSYAIIDDLEHAIAEARGRVAWLACDEAAHEDSDGPSASSGS